METSKNDKLLWSIVVAKYNKSSGFEVNLCMRYYFDEWAADSFELPVITADVEEQNTVTVLKSVAVLLELVWFNGLSLNIYEYIEYPHNLWRQGEGGRDHSNSIQY